MNRPVVLVFGGLDPTGGAGLAADVEAILACGARAAPVATALTVQDSVGVERVEEVSMEMVRAQARAVLDDLAVAALKVGMLGTCAMLQLVLALANEHPTLPLVVDPVLRSGRGDPLGEQGLPSCLTRLLAPRAWLMTPNHAELAALVPGMTPAQAADTLLNREGQALLLTGGDCDTEEVVNVCYRREQGAMHERAYHWRRWPGQFHGSGCTLASAAAAFLARGHSLVEAVERAQTYAWQSLRDADRPGRGQAFPDRGSHE